MTVNVYPAPAIDSGIARFGNRAAQSIKALPTALVALTQLTLTTSINDKPMSIVGAWPAS